MSAQTFTIGELAREFDLTTRAIRFYEDMGLLAPGRRGPGGGQRVYSGRDRARLRLTLRAKRLGLSLTEVKDILDMYDSPRDTVAQLQRFLGVLAEHRAQLEVRLAELQANLEEVRANEEEARGALLRAQRPPSPEPPEPSGAPRASQPPLPPAAPPACPGPAGRAIRRTP